MRLLKQQSGFSLIELLVVFLVMSLALSLVGPAIGRVHSQHMAQQEMRLFNQYVRDAALYAFTHNVDATVLLERGSMTILLASEKGAPSSHEQELAVMASATDEKSVFRHDFDYLIFETISFSALKSGYITRQQVSVRLGERALEQEVVLKGVAYSEPWSGL